MNNRVSFHELAEFELNDAAVFFENEMEGLGPRFLSAVQAAVVYINNIPKPHPLSMEMLDVKC